MGKAVDTGDLADGSSPGAVAMIEALAGFGAAAEALFTTSDAINAHAREQTGLPLTGMDAYVCTT
jgi:hypothetical protein